MTRMIENDQPENAVNIGVSKLHTYKIMLKEYPDVLDINQVSLILGVCTKTAYKLLREKKIEHIKVGRMIRIPKIHLLSYLKVVGSI